MDPNLDDVLQVYGSFLGIPHLQEVYTPKEFREALTLLSLQGGVFTFYWAVTGFGQEPKEKHLQAWGLAYPTSDPMPASKQWAPFDPDGIFLWVEVAVNASGLGGLRRFAVMGQQRFPSVKKLAYCHRGRIRSIPLERFCRASGEPEEVDDGRQPEDPIGGGGEPQEPSSGGSVQLLEFDRERVSGVQGRQGEDDFAWAAGDSETSTYGIEAARAAKSEIRRGRQAAEAGRSDAEAVG